MLKPFGERVLLKPIEVVAESASGLIIIPDSAKEKPQEAEVVAVGPGRDTKGLPVQVGDRVLYGKFAGTELKHEGVTYILINMEDILGRL